MDIEAGLVQKTHQFTLLYSGIEYYTDEMADVLDEAGCDDALIGMRNGLFFASFGREAPTYREALISAIEDIERADQSLRLVRVEPLDVDG